MFFSAKKRDSIYRLGQELPLPERFRFSEKQSPSVLEEGKNRLMFAMLLFCAAFAVVGGKLCTVSLCGFSEEPRRERQTQTRALDIKMERADITDRNGVVLATSLPSADLYVNTEKLKNPETLAAALAETLPDVKYKTLLKNLKSGKKFVYVKRNLIPREQYEVNRLGFPQLNFEKGEVRLYPQGPLFSHVLGWADIDGNGIAGVELAMNDKLMKDKEIQRLSLDAGVQDAVRSILADSIKKYMAEGASAILMNAKTGEIVSMVSLPDFDPNNRRGAIPPANTITAGKYELGSVMKTFNTAIGLDSGSIKVSDTFDARTPLILAGFKIQDEKKVQKILTLSEVMEKSSNIGSAKIALSVGKKKQREYLEKFGLLSRSVIELPETVVPSAPTSWGDLSTATIGYGYGLSVSPLHVVAAAAAVVNGGVYHTPTLLSRRTKSEKIDRRVISEKTSAAMRAIMRKVVMHGTARQANVPGFEVGGKTGSARKVEKGKYVEGKIRTSFLGAFPMDDPQYVLMVMIDAPKGIAETHNFNNAGWNAVPTAGNIISTVAPQLGILPRPFDNKTDAPYVKAALETR